MAKEKRPVSTEIESSPPARGRSLGPFDSLRHEIDRLFDDFRPFGWSLPSARSVFEPALSKVGGGWPVAPAIDLAEREKEWELTAELPGLDDKDIEVKVSNQTLTIRGEKKEEREEKEKDYHLSERRYGSFQRSFRLPEGIDENRIGATFAKGVLTVTLPKTTQARTAAKKIDVKPA